MDIFYTSTHAHRNAKCICMHTKYYKVSITVAKYHFVNENSLSAQQFILGWKFSCLYLCTYLGKYTCIHKSDIFKSS